MVEHVRSVSTNPYNIKRSIIIYLSVALFLCLEMALQVSPSVMADSLMQDLSLTALGLGVMSGFYFYTYTAMQLPSGLLFDQFNPRFIIMISIITCALGALMFSLSQGIVMGCLARLLMGGGSAFAFVAVLVVTRDLFPARQFAVMTGITQMLAALGAMTGQFPVSIAVSYWGWRLTMGFITALGLVLSILIWFLFARYQRPANTDLEEAPHLLTKIKIVLQKRQSWIVALYACLLWAPMASFASLWGVPYLQQAQHLTKHSAALLCSFMWLGLAVASPLLGAISTRYGSRVIPLIASAFIGVISLGLINAVVLPKSLLAMALLLAGAACSGQALSFSVIKENNRSDVSATAIAFNNMAVVVSGAIFQPLIGQLIMLSNSSHTVYHPVVGMVTLGCYLAAVAIAALGIQEPKRWWLGRTADYS